MVDNLNPNNSDNEKNYSIKEIFTTLLRRKKLLLVSTLLFFSGTVGFTIHERFRNPVYRGNFALLIADPIGSERIGSGSAGGFQSLAINKSDNDVSLLKSVLADH